MAGSDVAVSDGQAVGAADQQAADRRERLRVAEHGFALLRIGEELREPRHRRHELDADADECRAAQDQQLRQSDVANPAPNAEKA